MSSDRRKSSSRKNKRRSLNFDNDDDVIVCTSGFDGETKRRIKVWVEDQNATFQTKFRSDTTTHLVSKNVLSEKYKAAVQGTSQSSSSSLLHHCNSNTVIYSLDSRVRMVRGRNEKTVVEKDEIFKVFSGMCDIGDRN